MRIIVSGGGTGGHIYPAITLIQAIQKIHEHVEVLYVGTAAGLEGDIVPKAGLPFRTVEIKGFERKLSLNNVKIAVEAISSVWTAHRMIKEFHPDVVVGTGGYVCGPVLLAASLQGIPTLIQEQNVFAGITNRILGRFVDKVALGYDEARTYFPLGKVVFTGNPIRSAFMTVGREESLREFGLNSGRMTILVSGGSRGARSINKAMLGVHRHFRGSDQVQILHVTGKQEYRSVIENLAKDGINEQTAGNIMVRPYLYDMPKALASADLAIFRSGAVGLAELTAKGIPAILVPYPYAAEDHQTYNALAMQSKGAAMVINDRDLTAKRLVDAVETILGDRVKLQTMAAASLSMGRPEAADQIAALIVALAQKNLQ